MSRAPRWITIPSSWLALAGHRLEAAFWLDVMGDLVRRDIDPATATEDQVRESIATVQRWDAGGHPGAVTIRDPRGN